MYGENFPQFDQTGESFSLLLYNASAAAYLQAKRLIAPTALCCLDMYGVDLPWDTRV